MLTARNDPVCKGSQNRGKYIKTNRKCMHDCMCAIHFLRCLILQLTSFTTSLPDVPTVRSMYTYCNDDLRKSSRVVCLKRRVICLLNLYNARCKITLISLNHSELFNINIISKASLFKNFASLHN